MSEQSPGVVEAVKTPEASLGNEHFRAVHGRFLMGGDALNPAKSDVSVTKESLGSMQSRDYSAFVSASTNERKQNALVPKDQLTEAVNNWSKDTADVLNQNFSTKIGYDAEKAARWQQNIGKILGVESGHVTQDQVKALYEKYFSGESHGSNVKLFVADVLKAFNNDLSAIEQNLDCVEWLSNVFGGQSASMIRELVQAEALLINHPDQLIEELGKKQSEQTPARINQINPEEKVLLEFVWQGKSKTEVIVIKKSEPDDKGEGPPKKEKSVEDAQKERYLAEKKANVDYIDQSTLETFNSDMEKLGLKPVTAEYFDNMKKNKAEKEKMAGQLVISTQRVQLTTILMQNVAAGEYQKLSQAEKKAIDLSDEVFKEGDEQARQAAQRKLDDYLKENSLDLEAIGKKIEAVVSAKSPQIKAQVDQAMVELEAKIAKWEGDAAKSEAPKEKPEEKEQKTTQPPPAEKKEEKTGDVTGQTAVKIEEPTEEKKKKGLLARLRDKFKAGFKEGVDQAKAEAAKK